MSTFSKVVFVFLVNSVTFAKTDISGRWISECNLLDQRSFNSKIVFTNAAEALEFKLFEDTACKNHSLTIIYEAHFITGAKFGEGKKFNSTPTKVQMIVHRLAVLDQFNNPSKEDGCGLRNWKLETPKDVSGKTCQLFKMPTLGKTLYDIYKLNLNSLVFGGLPLKWDMIDPSARPKQLSKIEFWIEKNNLK